VLDGLERKLAAIVADAVAARTHLSVVQATTAPGEPAAGKGVLRVGLAELEPEAGFGREDVVIERADGAERARRVLLLGFRARIAFVQRPANGTPEVVREAHDLLLEDLARVAFALAEEPVRSGRAFATAGGDPGFQVLGFALHDGSVTDAPAHPSGRLDYSGRAAVWPPEVAAGGGAIAGVDVVTEALPLRFDVTLPVVATGGSTTVRVLGAAGRRLSGLDPPAFAPLRLALTVLSDLPPAGRGAVTSGSAGARAGLRIVSAADAAGGVTYAAPTGDLGTVDTEYVAVHLATPDDDAGVFLGSTAIGLREAS
jgi:hypothetical protein